MPAIYSKIMSKRLVFSLTIVALVFLLLDLIWSLIRGGNLNFYVQNEYGNIKEGRYDINVLVDEELVMGEYLFYDQIIPESESGWIGPGFHSVKVESKTLGLSSTQSIFVYSATWVVFEVYKGEIRMRVSRFPITLQ